MEREFKKQAEKWSNKIIEDNKEVLNEELYRFLVGGIPCFYHSTEDGIKPISKQEFDKLKIKYENE